MFLQYLSLNNLRRHDQLTINFSEKITVIIGENATGKTTVAEAIQFLSIGESFRANTIDEVISFESELGRVNGNVISDNEETTLEVILTRGQVQGKRTQKRLFSINGVRRRKKDFVGTLTSVIFKPEDMRLVEGSPSRRRAFVDIPLSLVSSEYAHSVDVYEKTLIRRNKLLAQVQAQEQPRTVLHYWNNALIKHGEIIQRERQKFFQTFILLEFPILFSVVYQPSIISAERQAEYLDREIASGRTLIGPHKDDFEILLHQWRGIDSPRPPEKREFVVSAYGSRGQQRLAVLWLKLCELQFIEQMHSEKPVLILDDILSELDEESKIVVTNLLQGYQTIITTTQEADIDLLKSALNNTEIKVIHL